VIVVNGGDLILPGRVISAGSLVIDGGRIVAVESRRVDPAGATMIDASDCYVAPGFIDVHVHGLHGHDTLDGDGAIARIAALLPRYGVTAFSPTTVACAPEALRSVLQQIREARVSPIACSARVLPAHLESNFINPEYKGAQPAECLRTADASSRDGVYSGREILEVIAACRPDVGIVTIAPELPGGLDLVRTLATAGHRVALGHSGSDYNTAIDAIDAGARHATHLFNRMTPMSHRAPGLPGAVLAREEVTVELICDGYHVHPSMCRVAMAAKGPEGVMAITDATSGAGLALGSTARLGGRAIEIREHAAFLEDGTLAGSTLTMDRAFRNVVTSFGGSLVDAATVCSTSPARALGLSGFGVLSEGTAADLVVLDRSFHVVLTLIGGREAFRAH
jgi:N-acetylglucosamine-6-phosphate deacetylase